MASSNPLCRYRHLFGIEGKGVHSYRLFDIAIVDTLLTILGSWIISAVLRKPFLIVFFAVLILGTILHRLFCVKTTVTKWVFGNDF